MTLKLCFLPFRLPSDSKLHEEIAVKASERKPSMSLSHFARENCLHSEISANWNSIHCLLFLSCGLKIKVIPIMFFKNLNCPDGTKMKSERKFLLPNNFSPLGNYFCLFSSPFPLSLPLAFPPAPSLSFSVYLCSSIQ